MKQKPIQGIDINRDGEKDTTTFSKLLRVPKNARHLHVTPVGDKQFHQKKLKRVRPIRGSLHANRS